MPAGIPLPASWWKRVLTSTNFYDGVIALVTLPTALIMAQKLAGEGHGVWVYGIPAVVFLATGAKLFLNDRKEKAEAKIHALEGALHVLHKLMLDAEPPAPGVGPKLRLTVHLPDRRTNELVQLLDYVGDQRRRNTAGRRTRNNCGVIGAAFSMKAMADGKRKTPEQEVYVKELTEKWHFQEDAARALDASAMAWLAVPLMDGKNEVVAVLFMDAIDPDFFTDRRVQLSLGGATGIAEFVRKRYF